MFVGNIQAAGVGWNGTAAATVAFAELAWTPGEILQAEDRCHRLGAMKPITIYYLLAQNTLEPSLASLLEKKNKILSQTLDGKRMAGDFDIYTKLAEILGEKRS